MINKEKWEHINQLIGKGYIERDENEVSFQLNYVEKHKEELDLMLGLNVNSVDEEKLILHCQSDWTCDGDIFEKGTNKLLAKNLNRVRDYGRPCINECYSFIKTHPFSASLKVEGEHVFIYYCEDQRYMSPCSGLVYRRLNDFKFKLDCCNPMYSLHFIYSKNDGYFYLVGITNRESETQIPQHRFEFIVKSLLQQSLPEGETNTDFTGVRLPPAYPFRTFQQAVDWIKINGKTLILTYDNGFVLKLNHEGIKTQDAHNENPPPEAA